MLQRFSQIARCERRAIVRRAFINSLPVLMGYTTMGFAAGVLFAVQVEASCAPVWEFFLAALVISGTMSFAIVPAIVAGTSIWGIALLTLGINLTAGLVGRQVRKRSRQ